MNDTEARVAVDLKVTIYEQRHGAWYWRVQDDTRIVRDQYAPWGRLECRFAAWRFCRRYARTGHALRSETWRFTREIES